MLSALLVLLVPGAAPAQEEGSVPRRSLPTLELSFGGHVQTDLRFRIQEKSIGPWYDRRTLPVGLSRNETFAKFKLQAALHRYKGVVDTDLVWVAIPDEIAELAELSDRRRVEPFRLEAHAAYIDGSDLFGASGLDLRFGLQKVMWGMGDQFNPTNNLNANDLEDPLLFGEQQANLMLKLDYSPLPLLSLTGVMVPVFRPALLPPSGELGLAAIDRLPFLAPETRYRVASETQMALEALDYGTVAAGVTPILPETSPENMQFAFRAGGSVGGQDLALSYYRGFSDFPVPVLNVSSLSEDGACENDPAWPEVRTDPPGDDEACVGRFINTEAYLEYPRIQVVGLNWAGEIPGAIGYRLEFGLYLPEARRLRVFNPEIAPFTVEGEYDYDGDGEPGGGEAPLVVSSDPFAKWTVGVDYTVAAGPATIMFNAQWVHGLVDEFGAGDWAFGDAVAVRQSEAIGGAVGDPGPALLPCATEGRGRECAREVTRPKVADYLVFGTDINFARNRGLFRLFTLWDLSGYTVDSWNQNRNQRVREHFSLLTPEGFTAVLYPELRYNLGYGFELHAGLLLQLGRNYTKFGDPAAGGSQVFVRGKFSY
jgi:hypothetical protein